MTSGVDLQRQSMGHTPFRIPWTGFPRKSDPIRERTREADWQRRARACHHVLPVSPCKNKAARTGGRERQDRSRGQVVLSERPIADLPGWGDLQQKKKWERACRSLVCQGTKASTLLAYRGLGATKGLGSLRWTFAKKGQGGVQRAS